MSFEKPKTTTSQRGDGSPAQIWAELDLLAAEIFGSSKSAILWAERFEEINGTAASSEESPELEGLKNPAAECVIYSDTTQHNTTQHNAMIQ